MPTSPRPFRFALQAFSTGSSKEWADTARQAEDLGYTTLFTTDHYFGPGEIASSSGHRPVDVAPIAAMMAAAGVTNHLRVGCRVFCVDYHHPVVLAKELATVDLLTDGRLEVGLGAGWVAAEYEGMGIPMDRPGVRIDRLSEYVGLVRAHWTGEPLDIDGTYVHAHGFEGRPPPVQTPHPPIMIGGGAPRVLRTAGQLADIVSFNFNNSTGTLGSASVASATVERTKEKIQWVREGAGDRFDQLELEVGAYFVTVTDDPVEATAAMASRFGIAPEELASHPHALLGTVDGICETLLARREELGISYLTISQRNAEEFAPVVARLTGT